MRDENITKLSTCE